MSEAKGNRDEIVDTNDDMAHGLTRSEVDALLVSIQKSAVAMVGFVIRIEDRLERLEAAMTQERH